MARAHSLPPRIRLLFISVVALLIPLIVSLVAFTTPASTEIYDADASPQSLWVIDTVGGDDIALDVAVNKAGTAYVCGQVTSAGGDLDGSLYKFPLSGSGWRTTWDAIAHDDDSFAAVAVAPDGTVYTAGWNRNVAGNRDIRLVKWSSKGVRLWSRRYNGPARGDDTASDVVVDAKGNVTVCGSSQGSDGTAFTVVSWTKGGTLRWVRRIAGRELTYSCATSMIVDGSGNLYVTGQRGTYGGILAGFTVKLTSANVRKWSRHYTGADTVYFRAATKRPGGGVYVCGDALGFDTGWDGVVVGYTAAGTAKVFALDIYDGDDSTDTFYTSVAATPNGRVGVASTVSFDYGASFARQLRVYSAESGTVIAGLTWGDTDWQGMAAVAADAYGGLYFTGTDAVSGTHTTIWTRRYSTIMGGGTWTSVYGAGDAGMNEPKAVATWKTTVWVVGKLHPGGGDADQVVLKYVY